VGEADRSVPRLSFNRSIRVEGRPERLSADAGAILLRELDERLSLTSGLVEELEDPRNQDLITHPLAELVRARLYAMALGHRAQDDLDRLRDDPSLRLSVSERSGDGPLRPQEETSRIPDGLASQPTQSRLVEALSTTDNLSALHNALFDFAVAGHRALRRHDRARNATIDVDSFPISAHGSQDGASHSGHYHEQCFHPLVAMLAGTGDWLDVALRPGSVHTSVGLEEFLLPVVERVEQEICQVARVRGDAGMPSGRLLAALDGYDRGKGRRRGIPYVFRLPSNDVLERLAKPLLKRPPGRRPNYERTFFHELRYQAGTWDRERRVVLVVIDEPDTLFLHHFFLLTSDDEEQTSGAALLDDYRGRSTMEGHIGDLKDVLRPALSSTSRLKSHVAGQAPKTSREEGRDGYAANDANLLLFALAYNLANTTRRVTAKATRTAWRLRRLRDTLLRTPARLVLHARRVTVVLRAEVAPLWARFLRQLDRLLPIPPPKGV
jgi:hypothetical protein